MAAFAEYTHFDGMGLAELVRTRQVTPLELVEAAIAQIEAHNGPLNAVIHKLYNQARTAAQGALPEGPFTGVPFLVKDLVSPLAGSPLGAGTRALRHYVPTADGELVRRWKASGVVIVGKTNTPELGLTPYTEPEACGITRNPWAPERSAGGSSGGSGAAVAARFTPLASGGDGGGSIRIPSSCNGLFGLKPTRARTPAGPYGELWQGFAIEHVLTRSVRDSAAMLDATMGEDPGAPYAAPQAPRSFLEQVSHAPGKLRIAFTDKALVGRAVTPAPEVLEGLQQTVRLLQELGHTVEEAAPVVDGEALSLAFATLLTGQTRADIEEMSALVGRRPRRGDWEAATWALGLLGKAYGAGDYVKALHYLQMEARKVAAFFTQYDLLLSPVLSQLPILHGALQPAAAEQRFLKIMGVLGAGGLLRAAGMLAQVADKSFGYITWCPLFNVTGQPAMSVPLHWTSENIPVGMQFAGRIGDEATLFRLAGQLEQARPWGMRRPGLEAV